MLSVKQKRFASEYLRSGGNATEAAKLAGYSPKTAYSQGQRLLKHVEIKRFLKRAFDEEEITRTEVLRELKRIGLNDPRKFFTLKGNAVPIQRLSAEVAAALAGFEVVTKNAKAGDGHTDTVLKYKLCNKNQALETLCKVFKLMEPDDADAQAPGPVFILPEGTKVAIK